MTASGADADFITDVRTWIAANWSLQITVREWWRRLAEANLSRPEWPAPYGRGLRADQGRAVTRELAAAGEIAPPRGTIGSELAGPTILAHGSREQQASTCRQAEGQG